MNEPVVCNAEAMIDFRIARIKDFNGNAITIEEALNKYGGYVPIELVDCDGLTEDKLVVNSVDAYKPSVVKD
jgi:hypothetical protein